MNIAKILFYKTWAILSILSSFLARVRLWIHYPRCKQSEKNEKLPNIYFILIYIFLNFLSHIHFVFYCFQILFNYLFYLLCVPVIFEKLNSKKLKQKNTLALHLVIVPLIYKQSLLCFSHVKTYVPILL